MKSEKLLRTVRLIKGDNVCLEPFSFKRLLKFYALYKTSREAWERFITLQFLGLDDVKRFLAQQTENDAFVGYVILEKKSYKPVGFILGDEISDLEVAFTYAVGVQYEGRGYAYEARTMFENALKEAGYASILSICDAENTRNTELLLRAGYAKKDEQEISAGAVCMTLEIYAKSLL